MTHKAAVGVFVLFFLAAAAGAREAGGAEVWKGTVRLAARGEGHAAGEWRHRSAEMGNSAQAQSAHTVDFIFTLEENPRNSTDQLKSFRVREGTVSYHVNCSGSYSGQAASNDPYRTIEGQGQSSETITGGGNVPLKPDSVELKLDKESGFYVLNVYAGGYPITRRYSMTSAGHVGGAPINERDQATENMTGSAKFSVTDRWNPNETHLTGSHTWTYEDVMRLGEQMPAQMQAMTASMQSMNLGDHSQQNLAAIQQKSREMKERGYQNAREFPYPPELIPGTNYGILNYAGSGAQGRDYWDAEWSLQKVGAPSITTVPPRPPRVAHIGTVSERRCDQYCPRSFCWQKGFDILVDGEKVKVTVKIKTEFFDAGPSPTLQTMTEGDKFDVSVADMEDTPPLTAEAVASKTRQWEGEIAAAWNDRFVVERADGEGGPIPVEFSAEFVESGQNQTVNIFAGKGRSNTGNWYLKGQDFAAHEYGHYLGNDDEYPDRGCQGRWAAMEPNIMSKKQAPPAPEHLTSVTGWLQNTTGVRWNVRARR